MGMFAVIKRVEPEEHMDRWYLIAVQETLFEPLAVVCAWGSRETSYQQMRILPADSVDNAQALAVRIIAQKLKRGYVLVDSYLC